LSRRWTILRLPADRPGSRPLAQAEAGYLEQARRWDETATFPGYRPLGIGQGRVSMQRHMRFDYPLLPL
jgi:hypothetical protein